MLGCVLANLIIVLGTIAMIKILKDIERQERQNIKREYISAKSNAMYGSTITEKIVQEPAKIIILLVFHHKYN
jgi:hypothetical protein